jgi:hypothetical protein
MSSKGRKAFRFGLKWVVLGIAVPIPMRADRYYCLPVLWRLFRKKGQPGYQTRPQSAAVLANPERTFWLVGDSAYVNAAVLRDRPANLQVIGPLHWKAALYERPALRQPKQRGASRKKGDRLPNPKAMIEDTTTYPAELLTIDFPKGARELRVQVISDSVVVSFRCVTANYMVGLRSPRLDDFLGVSRNEAVAHAADKKLPVCFMLGYSDGEPAFGFNGLHQGPQNVAAAHAPRDRYRYLGKQQPVLYRVPFAPVSGEPGESRPGLFTRTRPARRSTRYTVAKSISSRALISRIDLPSACSASMAS